MTICVPAISKNLTWNFLWNVSKFALIFYVIRALNRKSRQSLKDFPESFRWDPVRLYICIKTDLTTLRIYYFKNQFSRKTKQLSVQIKCSKQHWMLQKCIFLQFAIAQCGSKMSYSPAHEFSKHRASKSGQPTLKFVK